MVKTYAPNANGAIHRVIQDRYQKKIKTKLLPAQLELLEFVNFLDAPALIKSLEWLHDTTCYHSYEPIEEDEKFNLFNIKLLVEKLGGLVREG